jgi:flagellar motor component MotA
LIEIKIPKEIRDYKEVIFAGMNLRQIISLVVVFAINVPLYIFSKPHIGDELASWLVIIVGVPTFLVGFIKFDGMPFEKYFQVMLRFNFLVPRKRKYKVENIYTVIYEQQKKLAEENLKMKNNKKGRICNEVKKYKS